MKLLLFSIGKPHDASLKIAIDDFTRRINKYFNVEWIIIPSPKNAVALPEAELKKQESKIVLQKLNKDDFLVLLDESGKQFSSEELAQFLSNKATAGVRSIIFLIGGSYGVNEEIKQRANFTWSLSRLVFPHMLVRLMLAEQIYRACTILRNEKYHHA